MRLSSEKATCSPSLVARQSPSKSHFFLPFHPHRSGCSYSFSLRCCSLQINETFNNSMSERNQARRNSICRAAKKSFMLQQSEFSSKKRSWKKALGFNMLHKYTLASLLALNLSPVLFVGVSHENICALDSLKSMDS
jgi:hypothetical protein